MKISIITVNYNNSIGLKKTIESVTSQTYSDLEYIIIDGGSTDGSVVIIKENEEKINYWITEKDAGIYDAMNKGIKKATGDYLLFLNSGDYLYEQETLKKMAKSSVNANIIYGDIIFKGDQTEEERIYPDELDFDFFLGNSLPHPCTLIQTNLFKQFGLYQKDIKICADWAFFIDCIIKQNTTYQHIHQTISVFELGGLSSTIENQALIKNEKEEYLKKHFSFILGLNTKLKNYEVVIDTIKQSKRLKILKIFLPSATKKILFP